MCYPDYTIHQYIHTLSDIGGGSIVINYIFTLVEIALDCSAAHVTQSEIWGDPLRARTSLSESESEGIHGHSPHRVARFCFFFWFFFFLRFYALRLWLRRGVTSPVSILICRAALCACSTTHLSPVPSTGVVEVTERRKSRNFPAIRGAKKEGEKKSKFVDRVEGRLSDALSASLLQSICFLLLVMQIK